MENCGLDIHAFRQWAMGNLVENRNRGIFAEWLVGQALGVIGEREYRQEWDSWDLVYCESKIEVKAAGRGQAWPQIEPSTPRFDVAPKEWTWDPEAGDDIRNDPPLRPADVYVFCLHKPEQASNENVVDPDSWKFWVLSARRLDEELGQQKSVGLATLNRLAAPVGSIEWPEIRAEVDRFVGMDRVAGGG